MIFDVSEFYYLLSINLFITSATPCSLLVEVIKSAISFILERALPIATPRPAYLIICWSFSSSPTAIEFSIGIFILLHRAFKAVPLLASLFKNSKKKGADLTIVYLS